MLAGHFDDDGAALDVVQNGLPRVFFQHGDVLVGCRMENHLGLIGCADPIHQRNILNVAQNGPAAVEIEFVPKLHLDFKEVFLACVKQDQILRLKGDDLAAEFGADGTAAPRNQDRPSLEIMADALLVQLNGRPAQQVLVADVSELFDADPAIDDFAHAGQGLVFDAAILADLQNSPHRVSACRRDGDQRLPDLPFAREIGQMVDFSDDGNAVYGPPLFFGIVIDETDHMIVQLLVFIEFSQRFLARVAGADDEDGMRFPVLFVKGAPAVQMHAARVVVSNDQSQSSGQEERQHAVHQKNGAGIALESVNIQDDRHDQER